MAACHFDPYLLSYPTTKPDVDNLVGTWHPTSETRINLAKKGSTLKPRIEFFADGRITLREIPGETGDSPGWSFDGTWRLERSDAGWWGMILERPKWICSGCLMIMRNEPPHLLVARYGDPDEGTGYEFERPSNNALQRASPAQASEARR